MKRIELFPGGPSLSQIAYGAWRLLDDPAGADTERIRDKIDACLDAGITTIDHADLYGNYAVEERFGAALAARPHLRQRLQLVSKCNIQLLSSARPENKVKFYDSTPGYIKWSVERSLKLLQTDYLDLLLLHRPDPLLQADETAAALESLVKEGKVRAVGVSNFNAAQFDLLASRLAIPLATNQIEISLGYLAPVIYGQLDHLQQHRISPMVWSPLGGGKLFKAGPLFERLNPVLNELAHGYGATHAQLALAWLLQLPSNPIPIIGSNRPERIAELANATQIKLSRQDWFSLYTAALGHEVP